MAATTKKAPKEAYEPQLAIHTSLKDVKKLRKGLVHEDGEKAKVIEEEKAP